MKSLCKNPRLFSTHVHALRTVSYRTPLRRNVYSCRSQTHFSNVSTTKHYKIYSNTLQSRFSHSVSQLSFGLQVKDIFNQFQNGTLKYGDKITINGWIRSTRTHKTTLFADFNDGSSLNPLQLIFDQSELRDVSYGSCLRVTGILTESPGKKQPFEIKVSEIIVLGEGRPQDNPLQPKFHTLDFLREISHLRPRTNYFGAIFRLRNFLAMEIHNYFQKYGFIQVHTPIITGSDCEGAGEAFNVCTKHKSSSDAPTVTPWNAFFGQEAFLTVSGQLEAELFCAAFSRVYTFGPTFRAEWQSHTTRHLAEFWMLEPEIAFCDLAKLMDIAEDMVKYLLSQSLAMQSEELQYFTRFDAQLVERMKEIVKSSFERLEYKDAINILKKAALENKVSFPVAPEYGADLHREHEKYLTNYFKKPVFVVNWPRDIKAFYMKQNGESTQPTVAAMDLLVPDVGELIGGSVREESYEKLNSRITELGMNKNGNLDWYLDLRKFGTFPHAGFGMGFERLLQFVTATKNIRDVIPIPRYRSFCKF